MKKTLILILISLCLSIVPFYTMSAAIYEIYVSDAMGNDANTGTINAPYKTVQKAKEEVKNVLDGIVNVYIREGNYIFDETLNFDEHDSTASVTYQNYGNEKVIVSGGVEVSGFVPYENGLYRANIGTNLDFRQFYVNGKKQIRARYPNDGEYKILSAGRTGSAYLIDTTMIKSNLISNETELVVLNEWMSKRLRITSVNGTYAIINNTEITAITGPQGAQIKANDKYFLENSLNFLDKEGEWYYNKTSGYLYYKPYNEDPISNCVIPRTEKLIDVKNVNNLSFVGIDFAYTNWIRPNYYGHIDIQANLLIPSQSKSDEQYRYNMKKDYVSGSIEFSYANNFKIENCNFYHLGGSGVFSSMGGENINITQNTYTDIAGTAIHIGEDHYKAIDKTKYHKNVNINNNYIDDVANEYFGGVGICILYVTGLDISNNTLKNFPYSGISAGWGWATYEAVPEARDYHIYNNYLENMMTKVKDGGAIYIPNPLFGANIVEGNYIKGNVQSIIPNSASVGIYHDGCGSNVIDRNNFIENYRLPITFQNISSQIAIDITAQNNYFYPFDINDNFEALKARRIFVENTVVKTNLFFSEIDHIINNAGILPQFSNIIKTNDFEICDDYSILYLPIGKEAVIRFGIKNNTNEDDTINFTLSSMAGLSYTRTYNFNLKANQITQVEIPIKTDISFSEGFYTINIDSNHTYIPRKLHVVCAYDHANFVTVKNGGYKEYGDFSESGIFGYNNVKSRYGYSNGSNASFQTSLSDGNYDVYFYNVSDVKSDPNAKIEVVHSDGVYATYINQATAQSGFIHLGKFRFSGDATVKITKQTDGYVYIRTSAVLFNRNDDISILDCYFDDFQFNFTMMKNTLQPTELILAYYSIENKLINCETFTITKSTKLRRPYRQDVNKVKAMLWHDFVYQKPIIESVAINK